MATVTQERLGQERGGQPEDGWSFSGAGIDPALLQVGVLVGLLTDAGQGTYEVNTDWFHQPWTYISKIPADHAGDLLSLLDTLVGSIAPGAVGQGQEHDGMLWYPIAIPGVSGGTDSSPLFLVGPPPGTSTASMLGVGARYSVSVDGIAFAAYAYLPVLQVGGGTAALTALESGLPSVVYAGLEVTGADLAAGTVSLGGLQFRAAVELAGGAPQLDLVFLQLRLPGQAVPSDQTLPDVMALGASEWIATALSVLVGEVATLLDAETAKSVEAMLAAALGLLGIDSALPSPPWSQLLSGDPTDALLAWAGQIAGSDQTLRQWLTLLAQLLDPTASAVLEAEPAPTGSGSRADPYVLAVLSVAPLQLAVTVGTELRDGARHVYPGIRASAASAVPALPDATFAFSATTELADLAVTTSAARRAGAVPVHLPLASLGLSLTLRNSDAAKPLVSVPDPTGDGTLFVLGSALAGVRFDGASQTLAPTLELLGVSSKLGAWPVIDFASVDDVVKDAAQALTTIVTGAIDGFFGTGDGAMPEGTGATLAAMLGLAKPETAGSWPPALLLAAPSGIEDVVSDPIRALGAYYARVMAAAQISGEAPIAYLLGALGGLLGGPSSAAAGSGQSRIDPWLAPVVQGGGLTAGVFAWSESAQQLRLGLIVRFQLTFSDAVVTVEVPLELLALSLPAADGSGDAGVAWAADANLSVALSGASGAPLSLGELGGVITSMTGMGVSGGWGLTEGFYAVVEVNGATLTASGITVPLALPPFVVGPQSWTEAEFTALTAAAIHLIGLWLTEHGGRMGVALTALFGLLPDPAAVLTAGHPWPVPPDFVLPSRWPVLAPSDPATFFTAPWHDLTAQLAAVFASAATGDAGALLIGWAITGTASPTTAAGSREDPFAAALGGPVTLELLIWREGDPAAGALGIGVRGTVVAQESTALELGAGVRVDVLTIQGPAARAPAAPAAPVGAAGAGVLPALDLLVTLSNPVSGQPLVSVPAVGLEIGSVELGAAISSTGLAPIVTFLRSRAASDQPLATIDLDQALESSEAMQWLGTLIGAAFELLSSHTPGVSSRVDAALAILTEFELLGEGWDGGVGILIASWLSLIADPQDYVAAELDRILADGPSEGALFRNLAELVGLPPAAPSDGLRCLAAVGLSLGLCRESVDGPVPAVPALLRALANPLAYARAVAPGLLGSATAVQELMTALSVFAGKAPLPLPIPGLSISVGTPTSVTLSAEATPLGDALVLSGALVLDLKGARITGQANVGVVAAGAAVAVIGQALVSDGSNASTSWEVDLVSAAAVTTPSPFAPIRLVGSAGGIEPAQVAVAVPTFALSVLASAAVNGFLLPNSPLAQEIVVELGLAPRPLKGQTPQVSSVLGAIMHPLDWLAAVLGDGSAIDLPGLGKTLAQLAAGGVDGPGSVRLEPVGDIGLRVTGLPCGASLTLTATADELEFAATVSETAGGVTLGLSPALTYDPRTGLGASGGAQLSTPVGAHSLAIAASYGSGASTLSATADTTTINLVPFPGLNALIDGATQALLGYIVGEAWQAYEKSTPPPAVKTLVTALQEVSAALGITSVATLEAAARQIIEDPVAWLAGLESKAGAIASAIADLLTTTLGLHGVTASGGQIVYAPTLGQLGTLSLGFGWDAAGNLTVQVTPTLTPTPLKLTAGAGASVKLPLGPTPQWRLTLDGALALDASAIPGLPLPGAPTVTGSLELGPPTQFALSLDLCGVPAGDAGHAPGRPDTATPPLPIITVLPDLTLDTIPSTKPSPAEWLFDAGCAFALPVLGSLALGVEVVEKWLTTKASSGKSVADILAATGLLASAQAPLTVRDPRTVFGGLAPEAAVAKLLAAALQAMTGVNLLPKALKGTAAITSSGGNGEPAAYGLQVAIPDITIATSPQVLLQIGSWPTGGEEWIKHSLSSAPDADQLGIDVELVTIVNGVPSLSLGLALVSVGIDVKGTGKQPLLEIAGCRLGGVEARAYAAIGTSSPAATEAVSWYAGGAIRLDDLGVPLGPKLAKAASFGDNAVAANLLASANEEGGGPGKAVNPTFSVLVADVQPHGTLDVTLLGSGQPGDTAAHITIPLQQALGPLYLQDVTLSWDAESARPVADAQGPLLGLGVDGSAELAGLSVDVVGLGVKVPVMTPQDLGRYRLTLSGLEIAFAGGPVSINGGLVEVRAGDGVEYDGTLAVQAGQFGLGVIGSYGTVKVADKELVTMWAFGFLNAPIGGPPCFYVTGLAAGFGYNRSLALPGQDEVSTFPLIEAVTSTDTMDKWRKDPGQALAALGEYVKAQPGEYWLAAGVKFTSFELLDSFALLAVQFGADFTIALLGVSTLTVPNAGGEPIEPIARATLGLEAVFKPTSGTLALSAVLSPDSYVLDKAAHLTGGFAFDVWWQEPHPGQFVLTLGGYSPRFDVPDFYPKEQPLGLNWVVGGGVQIVGGAYFALTPSAVMAGGELSVTFTSGDLKAWAQASADFLIRWKPFSFAVSIAVSIGASYRLSIWGIHHTFTIELGASLDLQGMPIHGRAEIHWFIISFSVPIGTEPATQARALTFPEFEQSFLQSQPSATTNTVQASVASGLVASLDQTTNSSWIVASRFTLVTSSLIPSTSASLNGTTPGNGWNSTLGVRPMAAASMTSSHVVTLIDAQHNPVPTANLAVTATLANVPAALWSPNPQEQATPTNELVEHALVGLQISSPCQAQTPLMPFAVSLLVQDTSVSATWAPPSRPDSHPYPGTGIVGQVQTALRDQAVTDARTTLVSELTATFPQLIDGSPTVLAQFADQVLQAQPVLTPLGAEPTVAPAP